MMQYFRELRYIWRMRIAKRLPESPPIGQSPVNESDEWGDWLMDITVGHHDDHVPRERIKVVDCFSTTHNRGTVPGLLPPIPDGHVTYSVWVHWTRGGAGWLKSLYSITIGIWDWEPPVI